MDTKKPNLALVVPGQGQRLPEASVRVFKRAFASTAVAGAANSSSYSRPVPTGGYQVHALLVSVEQVQTFYVNKFVTGDYNKASYDAVIAGGASAEHIRWNAKTQMIEMACERYLTNDEARRGAPKHSDNPEEWLWVPLPKLALVSFVLNKPDIPASHVPSLYQLFNLVPRLRDPSKLKPGNPIYGWRVARSMPYQGGKGKIPDWIMSSLAWNFPDRMFRIEDPRHGLTQESVFLRVVPPWDDATLDALLARGTNPVVTALSQRGGQDGLENWLYAPNNLKEEPIFWYPSGKKDDVKKRFEKYYSTSATIAQVIDNRAQFVTSETTLWNNDVEKAFCVKDPEIWYSVFRFVVPSLCMVIIAGVVAEKTAQASLNLATAEETTSRGIDLSEQAIKEEAESSAAAAAPTPSTAAPTPAAAMPEGAEGAESIQPPEEDVDMEDGGQDETAMAASAAAANRYDFAIALNAKTVYIDIRKGYRQRLIPVTPAWVEAGMDLIGADNAPVLDPKSGKPKRVQRGRRVIPAGNLYPPGTKVALKQYPLPNFSQPDRLPAVICVSDYLPQPGIAKEFSKLVAAGKGEYRVAVNQPMLASAEHAPLIYSVIEGLTPAEGVELLDTGAVKGKPMPWGPIPNPVRYAIVYINYGSHASEDENALTMEWAAKIVEHLKPREGAAETPAAAADKKSNVQETKRNRVDPSAEAGDEEEGEQEVQQPATAQKKTTIPFADVVTDDSASAASSSVAAIAALKNRRRPITPAAAAATSAAPSSPSSNQPAAVVAPTQDGGDQ